MNARLPSVETAKGEAAEPTPGPSLQGGEKDENSAVASGEWEKAVRAFTPLPEGRGDGGVGSSALPTPFGRPGTGSAPALADIVKTYAAQANDYQRAMFVASLPAALTLEEVREAVGRLGYGPETVQQTSDRHWTWSAIRS